MAANPNVPSISRPLAEVMSLTTVAEQLRQGVESLAGVRGGPLERAVTLADLITLGLVTEGDIKAKLK